LSSISCSTEGVCGKILQNVNRDSTLIPKAQKGVEGFSQLSHPQRPANFRNFLRYLDSNFGQYMDERLEMSSPCRAVASAKAAITGTHEGQNNARKYKKSALADEKSQTKQLKGIKP
jgi:hypothetical protein